MNSFALIFDMDGTLLDNNPYHLAAWRGFLARHGVTLTEEEYLARVSGVNSGETIRRLLGADLQAAQVASLQAEKESLYRELISGHLEPIAGLKDFLARMASADIPMAVATSAPKDNIAFTLEGLGIRQYFRVVTGADMVRRAKPDPEIFLVTARRLGFAPAQCVVFEDSVSGIAAATAAGMHVVALRTAHPDAELGAADWVIDDYHGLERDRLKNLILLK
jgi:beta-phosphoglucomutase family hydrolase